jgi:hypothetical protein
MNHEQRKQDTERFKNLSPQEQQLERKKTRWNTRQHRNELYWQRVKPSPGGREL